MKILAITQARYGSTRLPAKILKEVCGMTLLEIHLHRILQSKLISKLKVATTTEEGAEYIINIADKVGVESYQGSVNDVLDRFYQTMDVEVFKYSVLERAWQEAALQSEREHVTPYIWKNSTVKGGKLFKSINVANDEDWSKERITVDTPDDFALVKNLIEQLGIEKSCADYVAYLDSHENIKAINQHYSRNEGYDKSLLND